MTVKAFFATMLAFLLSGCWVGPNFYTLAQGERPLAAGKYKHVGSYLMKDAPRSDYREDRDARVRIAYDDDGRLTFNDSEDGNSKALLVKLDGAPGVYVAQVDLGQDKAGKGAALYGLVWVNDDSYRIALPKCDGTRRIAPGSNVIVSGLLMGRRKCSFSDKASFEAEMRRFAQDPTSWDEYRLIKKKGA